jgi:hypothetical protein
MFMTLFDNCSLSVGGYAMCPSACDVPTKPTGRSRLAQVYFDICHAVSCPCHVVSCRVMSCHAVSGRVMPCHVVSGRVMSCQAVSCRVMSCHVVSCRVRPCHVVSLYISCTSSKTACSIIKDVLP